MTHIDVLYNHACPICRAEISHYVARTEATGAPLSFQDLNTADLGAWRMTEDQAMRRMHARLPDGTIVSGVEAFALIWERLPGYGWMSRLVRLPGIKGMAAFGYNRIAAPLIYRRQKRRQELENAGA